jgi:NAD(P)-dependent dehydrogenase (short-subunit alcohol dehydrogenase family)
MLPTGADPDNRKTGIGLGDVDVVFNNAGYGLIGPLEALSDDQIVRQLNTNLLGTIRVTQDLFLISGRKEWDLYFYNINWRSDGFSS